METLFLFSAVIDESLQHIIQLIILCIPLVMVPIIVQSSRSLGSIGKIADRVQKGVGLDKGLEKVRGGVGKRAAAYGKFGAIAGGKYVGRGVRNSNVGQRIAGNPNSPPGRVRRAGRKAVEGWRKTRAFDQAVQGANEARKQQKEARRQEEVATFVTGGTQGTPSVLGQALQNYGGSTYTASAASAVEEAEKKRVSGIYATFKMNNSDFTQLRDALTTALRDGDRSTVTAAINRLTDMGASGALTASDAIERTTITDPEMQSTVMKAINDGSAYGAFVTKDAGLVKGGQYDSNGNFVRTQGLAGVSADQLASQTDRSLQRHFATISQQQATEIMNNDVLRSKITNDRARQLINARANGATAPPPPPPPPPSDKRLKRNIVRLGEYKNIPMYQFQYLWSEDVYVGTLAQDILETHPFAVSKDKYGFYRVDYDKLDIKMVKRSK